MTRKSSQLETDRLKLSTIVGRLPLYRFLDQSRAAVLKLQPVWQLWLSLNLPDLEHSAAHLSGYDSGTITIVVNNSSTAALIKHQQESLKSALNIAVNQKIIAVTKVKVRINLSSTTEVQALKQQMSSSSSHSQSFEAPDDNAINSIKHLQSSLKNPDLADTMGNLAKTLETLSKTSETEQKDKETAQSPEEFLSKHWPDS